MAVMEKLAGDAHVSFEGDLRHLTLSSLQRASSDETTVLKRNTTWPKQDFVVLPLDSDGIETIMSAIGGSVPRSILHIQIEKSGTLQFGAYDQFHPECIFFGTSLDAVFLDSLISERVIERAA